MVIVEAPERQAWNETYILDTSETHDTYCIGYKVGTGLQNGTDIECQSSRTITS